jgi:four helix bundle protein
MTQNFQNIQVWQDAVQFHEATIPILRKFPKEEIYAMSSQLRRASLSISNNIAEGCGRESSKELRNFLNIAMGSVKETESMIVVAQKLSYIDKEQYAGSIQKIIIIGKKLNALMQRVAEQINKNNTSRQVGRSPKNQEPKTKNQQREALASLPLNQEPKTKDQQREAPASLPQKWE